MAKTLNCSSQTGTTTVAASTTRWYPFGTTYAFPNTPETTSKVKVPVAGVVSGLTFYVVTNATSGSSTVRTRKNTADGSQSVSVGAAATGRFQDLVNTDTIAATDLFNYQVTAAAGGAIAVKHMSTVFDPTNTAIALSTLVNLDSGGFGASAASTTVYMPLAGDGSAGTGVEVNMQYEARVAGTLKNLSVFVSSNARTTNTTYRSRRNTANGAMSVVFGSGATGLVEDLVNTDTIAVNDKINTSMTTSTGSGAIVFKTLKTNFEVTGYDGLMLCQDQTGITKSSTTTVYCNPAGSLKTSTTEADTKMTVCEAFTFSKLGLNITSNARTAATTFRSRRNEADGNQVVSVGATTTGWLEDTTNTDVCAATDYMNYSVAIATGTGNIVFRGISMVSTLVSGPTESVTLSESIAFTDSNARLRYRPKTTADSLVLAAAAPARLRDKLRSPSASQNMALVDTSTRLRLRIRTAADSKTLADSQAMLRGRARTMADSFVLTTAPLTKLTTRLRILAQSLTLADIHTRLESIMRLLGHSLALTDSNTRAKGKSKTTADSLTLTDSLDRLKMRIRALAADSLTLADTADRFRFRPKTISGSLTLADACATLAARLRATADSIALTDLRAMLRGKSRATTEPLTITDSPFTKLTTRLRTLSHSMIVNDQLATGSQKIAILLHTLTLTDTYTRLTTRLRTLTDSLSIAAASPSRLRGRARTLTESVSLTDSHAKLTTRLRTLLHSLAITDQLAKGGAKVASLSHPLTLTDSHAKLTTRLRIIMDALALASITVKLAAKQRSLADSVAFLGVMQQLKGGAGRLLSHFLTWTDSTAKQTTRIRVLAEVLGLSHATTRLKSVMRAISPQNMSLSDAVQKVKGKFRLLQESGPLFSSLMDKTVSRVRVITQNLQVLSMLNRLTSKARSLSHFRTLTDTVTAIKGGVGTAVLPTTVFIKHLTNKLIFKK